MENETCIDCLNYYKFDYKAKKCKRDPAYEDDHCKIKVQII